MSGGLTIPVAQGEVSRKNQPLGVNKNDKPNAIVTWGTDRNGDKTLCIFVNNLVPCQLAQNNITRAREIIVVANPVKKDKRIEL
jgi:hypothetical protein